MEIINQSISEYMATIPTEKPYKPITSPSEYISLGASASLQQICRVMSSRAEYPIMTKDNIAEFQNYLREATEHLEAIRQNI